MSGRKALVPLLTALLVGPLVAAPAWAEDGHFTDDNGNTHEGYIEAVAAAGIASGCSTTRYCPDSAVTRAQMASFLARAYELPAAERDYFSDDNGTTHEDNINRVTAADIANGTEHGTFNPGGVVSRAQMASFLARAAALPPGSRDHFSDDDGTTHEDNINRVAEAGIAAGTGAGFYSPNKPVTRAQMATFLGRALDLEEVLINPITDYLLDMEPIEGRFATDEGNANIAGETYTHSLFESFDGHCVTEWGYTPPEWSQSYDLGKDYKVFRTSVGVDDASLASTVVRMDVLLDGRPAGSWTMRFGEVQHVALDVRDVLRLELAAYFVEGDEKCWTQGSWVWGDARVLR